METHSLIHHFLEKSAELYPDKIALIHNGIHTQYLQINSQTNKLASWLIEQGIGKGDRIAIIFENCLEYVVSYYGSMKAGAVVAPLNTGIKLDGLRYIINELEPQVVIASSKFEPLFKEVVSHSDVTFKILIIDSHKLAWPDAPFSVCSLQDIMTNSCCKNPGIPMEETALANIIYTSGSTGKPKGVMLTHKNVVSNTYSIYKYRRLEHRDIQMTVLPFFYVMGQSLLNTHFAVGGSLVINNTFAFPASVVKQMAEEKVTGFSGVPSTYAYLLHRSPLKEYRDKLGSLRYCSQAGGHMARQIKLELREALPPHTKIYIMYGATEASARLSYLEPDVYLTKIESIGKAIPGVTLKLLDKHENPVMVGQIGELVAQGDNIMQGYWKDSKSTQKILDKNGYHTGDLGYQDADGYFYLTGRKDNILKVGGHRINTQEIEDALISTELVIEAVVFGVADTLLGNKLIALAVPRSAACTKEAVMAAYNKIMPLTKRTSDILLIKNLPKNTNGKIDREKCLALIKKQPID